MYDGLEHDKRLKEFHLDRELRQIHNYLPSDRQDSKTKQVRLIILLVHIMKHIYVYIGDLKLFLKINSLKDLQSDLD